jgi:NAD(P)-dependent dehydrogenase (short-subunit alcohol dehydrogenase family)
MTRSEQTSVLITGGNKGLGFEAARRLGEQGWTIFLGSRDEGRGRAAADKLTDGCAPGRLVAPADATADEIHSVYDTNVYGPLRVTHEFLPLLQAADHPRVVMVSSGAGSFAVITDPEQPTSKMHELAYSSSKAALNMITVRYAQALPKIKFNIATPGEVANRKFAATDMNNHTGQLTVTEGTD